MLSVTLTERQKSVVEMPFEDKIFLEGPPGAGKTTVALYRVLKLIKSGEADSILIIVPQRTLAIPYYDSLIKSGTLKGNTVTVHTMGSLAQSMVELFWPLVAKNAGFANPKKLPTFLTLETAQYYMASVINPLIERGYFQSLTIERNRIYSQIIDNLNKSALVGFPHSQAGHMLKSSWAGDMTQARIYEEGQICANKFREFCLSNNLVDFSLRVEIFAKNIWPEEYFRKYLTEKYKNIIFDNIEEDTPVTQDIMKEWLDYSDSALFIYDHTGGYRSFLGADPVNGYNLKNNLNTKIILTQSFITSQSMRAFAYELSSSLNRKLEKETGNIRDILKYENHRYHTQMIDGVTDEIEKLIVEKHVPPEEIVVIAPFLTDALRFTLMTGLENKGIKSYSHRPSRPLKDEPATQCLLTIASIAHPNWGLLPNHFDVSCSLMQAIEGLDLIRAQLLSQNLYIQGKIPLLSSFDKAETEIQERITYSLGEKYENLRKFIENYKENPQEELDHFLSRLFGEILSQYGYGFHNNMDSGEITALLIDSIKKFRRIVKGKTLPKGKTPGQEYMKMVENGLVADLYIKTWHHHSKEGILLAPAHTFLMSNRAVDYQFWLNIGSSGWWERIYQPITHPYILSRRWTLNKIWTDEDEYEIRQDALYRLVIGLIRRCRRKIYLGLSEIGEQGYEQQGPLLRAVQKVLKNT